MEVPGSTSMRTCQWYCALYWQTILDPVRFPLLQHMKIFNNHSWKDSMLFPPHHCNYLCMLDSAKSLTKGLLDQVLWKNHDFLSLVNHSPHAYAERMYLAFMKTVTQKTPQGDDDELCQELMKIGEIIQEVTKFNDRILNATGMEDDLAKVQHIWEAMQGIECWLEDILCGTLEGIDVLMKAYQDHMLLYQDVAK